MAAKKGKKKVGRHLVSFDWAMEGLLRKKANFDIIEGFLSELIGDDIKILEILETKNTLGRRLYLQANVDIKVRNKKGEIFFINVHHERLYQYIHRIRFGSSKVVDKRLNMMKVISVSIVYHDQGDGEDYVYHGITELRGLHNGELLEFTEEQKQLFSEYYLIKVKNFDNTVKNSLDEWIYYLTNHEIKKSFSAKGLRSAKERLEKQSLSIDERRAYEDYFEYLLDYARAVESNYEVGFMVGLEKARKNNLARKLLLAKVDMKVISETTGLTIEEIEAFADNSAKTVN